MSKSTKRKAKARAERSQRTVSIMVIVTIWLGAIVLLIMPARSENNDAKELAESARQSLEQVQEQQQGKAPVAVPQNQQVALARAIPNQFTLAAVEADLRQRGRGLTFQQSQLTSGPVDKNGVKAWTVTAQARGPVASAQALLNKIESNVSIEPDSGIVNVQEGLLLNLQQVDITSSGSGNVDMKIVVEAYSTQG